MRYRPIYIRIDDNTRQTDAQRLVDPTANLDAGFGPIYDSPEVAALQTNFVPQAGYRRAVAAQTCLRGINHRCTIHHWPLVYAMTEHENPRYLDVMTDTGDLFQYDHGRYAGRWESHMAYSYPVITIERSELVATGITRSQAAFLELGR